MYLRIIKLVKALTSIVVLSVLSACGGSGQSTQSPLMNSPSSTVAETPLALPVTTPFMLPDEIIPEQAVNAMGVGINLGNTLDAPNEGDWALPAQNSFMIAFKQAGFNHVRIPITWHTHTQTDAPYKVDKIFMDRVEQVVDWALSQDLYVIINAHHESWLKEHYQVQKNKNRIDSIWMQIAARFKNKPAKLIFEMLNEPNGMTMDEINQFNQRTLSIIRNENPNRLVVFSGNDFTPVSSLLATDIPDVQDNFLIGNFHNYEPWAFAGQCQRNWGSDEDRVKLRQIYQQAYDWSVINHIAVMMNEFGVAKYDFEHSENVCSQSARLNYLAENVSLVNEFGFTASFWDDGGSFSTFDRVNNSWGPEKNILVKYNK